MANRLFFTNDRNESHKKLEEAIASGNDMAECREGPKAGDYSVWDGPDATVTPAPAPEVPKIVSSNEVTIILSDADMEKLATLVAEKLSKLQG